MTTIGSSASSTRPTRVRWKGGAIVFFLCFVAYLDRIAFSVSASPIMKTLGIDPVQFGLTTTLFNVGYFLCQIPAGILIQRIGPRKAMALSILAWSIFTACTGLANSLVMLAMTGSCSEREKGQCSPRLTASLPIGSRRVSGAGQTP